MENPESLWVNVTIKQYFKFFLYDIGEMHNIYIINATIKFRKKLSYDMNEKCSSSYV